GIALGALADLAGAKVNARRRMGDDRQATDEVLAEAIRWDVTVISGGVSVGPHDHVRPALEELGVERLFWGVALRPGRPTWFGLSGGGARAGGGLGFGLPGDPGSAGGTLPLLLRPALRALGGVGPAAVRARAPAGPGYA